MKILNQQIGLLAAANRHRHTYANVRSSGGARVPSIHQIPADFVLNRYESPLAKGEELTT